jgi:hypothetical protein
MDDVGLNQFNGKHHRYDHHRIDQNYQSILFHGAMSIHGRLNTGQFFFETLCTPGVIQNNSKAKQLLNYVFFQPSDFPPDHSQGTDR